MNHLGDNFVDKHRYRPETDIHRFQLYFRFAAKTVINTVGIYILTGHLWF